MAERINVSDMAEGINVSDVAEQINVSSPLQTHSFLYPVKPSGQSMRIKIVVQRSGLTKIVPDSLISGAARYFPSSIWTSSELGHWRLEVFTLILPRAELKIRIKIF